MHFTTFDGVNVGYRQEGTGPAVVLVHGTGGDGAGNWGGISKELSKDYTVVRPDYTGSGETGDDGRELTVEYLASQILAVVDHVGVDSFAIVGFSLGAAISVRIAADHPERISNLILIAGFARLDPRLKIQFELWRDLIASEREAMAKLVLLTGISPDALSSWGFEGVDEAMRETVETQAWLGMARQVEVDLTLDVGDAVKKIVTPTLVIGATHDHMVPPAHSRSLAASIKGASYVELPTGHLAPMERPDLTASEIRNFLSKV
ncbi:alpha/beta hydrolase [Labrenzia sp. OB1]|uniref:alpha/beta fold hydrolase n=1 Tax=Labrenzia sp. OB1 TaxID=1561204 RepID=UPI0007B1FD0D|nr:alpha/beta hydrolase [Labrenzia sp. OB1]KZM48812.1 thioesterase [Labrenzia sp. OB1]